MRKKRILDYDIPAEGLSGVLQALEASGQWISQPSIATQAQRTYFDTFEWRLFNQGMLLYREGNQLLLRSITDPNNRLILPMRRDPIWLDHLPEGLFRDRCTPHCKLRRVFVKLTCQVEVNQLHLCDDLEKTLLRLQLTEFRTNDVELIRLRLVPLVGYDRALNDCLSILAQMGLEPAQADLTTKLFQRAKLDTRSTRQRLQIDIEPETGIAEAISQQLLLLHLEMSHQVQGMIADWDTEFLHQFRIAIRRARSILAYFRKTLPTYEVDFASQILRAWGKRTNALRDLDVLLLDRDHYVDLLPNDMGANLHPFFDQVKRRRQRVKRVLAKQLQSSTFQSDMSQLLHSFQRMAPVGGLHHRQSLSANVATQLKKRLKKMGQLLKDCLGGAPEIELHRLRIHIKKLRYIMISFEAIFPKRALKTALGQLKSCQKKLGERHDLEWQRTILLRAIAPKRTIALPVKTIHAIAMLAGVVHAKHHQQWPQVRQGLNDLGQVSFKKLLGRL